MRRGLRNAMVALCGATLAGCGLIGGVFGDGVPTFSLPLDAYELGPVDRAQVLRARFALITECLQQYRIDFQAPAVEPATYPKNADYLGWMDDRQVRRYGYAGPPGHASIMATDGFEPYSVTDEQFYVLTGKIKRFHGKAVPPGGCEAKVDSVLNQGAKGVPATEVTKTFNRKEVQGLADNASDAAWQDERVKAAERSWSDCMKRAGFDYRTPVDAMGDPRWATTAANDEIEPPRGTPEEIRTALADSACRREVDYYGIREAVYTEHQNKIITDHRGRLNTIRLLNEARLANAIKVLNGEIAVSW
ncbi:hypothetical protein [Microtetraspora fusca]|uniref:Lipoprotein n=1 Tax=Microtetraspora fusca TaxID=1997 RepID=A0ABW6V8X1_MICFU|nr:hypothetical protein [Microtetraspora fusca]